MNGRKAPRLANLIYAAVKADTMTWDEAYKHLDRLSDHFDSEAAMRKHSDFCYAYRHNHL